METQSPYPPPPTDLTQVCEFMHHVLVTHQQNYNEYDTDMATRKYFKKPWEKWKNSGYTDNNGYNFVVGLGQGGYVLA